MIARAQLGSLTIKSRFTFIDIEEQQAEPMLRRSASIPATLNSLELRQIAQEDKYLSGLLLEAMTSPIAFVDNIDSSTGNGTQAPARVVPHVDTQAAAEPSDGLPGSLGHPHFCRRPCFLLAYGHCLRGAACQQCHHPHGKQPELSKRIREKLKKMSSDSKLRLLRSCLLQQAQQVPELLRQVTGLLNIIEEELEATLDDAIGDHDAIGDSTISAQLRHKIASLPVAAMFGEMFTRGLEPDLRARLRREICRLRVS